MLDQFHWPAGHMELHMESEIAQRKCCVFLSHYQFMVIISVVVTQLYAFPTLKR